MEFIAGNIKIDAISANYKMSVSVHFVFGAKALNHLSI
jgi:hypothetical protein